MRARLMLKLMGIIVTLALTVVAAHSCSGSSSGSVLNPANVERYGLNGLCANQEAVAAADGNESPQTLVVPGSVDGLGGAAGTSALEPGRDYSCTPTTTEGG